MTEQVARESEINIKVSLNENKVPLKIDWSASDAGVDKAESNAMMLALWDSKEKNALRIDLWTKEMTIEEMKHFFHQTMMTMADTYERSTNENELAEEFRQFAVSMGKKMDVVR